LCGDRAGGRRRVGEGLVERDLVDKERKVEPALLHGRHRFAKVRRQRTIDRSHVDSDLDRKTTAGRIETRNHDIPLESGFEQPRRRDDPGIGNLPVDRETRTGSASEFPRIDRGTRRETLEISGFEGERAVETQE